MQKQFAIVHSEKSGEEAIKETALKLKAFFPKKIRYILCLYTSHYQPLTVLKTISYTLRPEVFVAIQAPLLIYEDRILEKGIICCCINKEETILHDFVVKNPSVENIESKTRMLARSFKDEKHFLINFIPPQFDPNETLRGLELALGKAFTIISAGFLHKTANKSYNIINNSVDDGLCNIIGSGLKIDSFKIDGFLPLGKPFKITKAFPKNNIITEINYRPAVEIYKSYLEEKFSEFNKNNFYPLYPLRINCENNRYLLTPLNALEDGSLVCLGNIPDLSKNPLGQICLLHAPTLIESLELMLNPVKEIGSGLIFMINSFWRKKTLKEATEKEIIMIKRLLGDNFAMIGLFADYYIAADKKTRQANIETNNILLNVWG